MRIFTHNILNFHRYSFQRIEVFCILRQVTLIKIYYVLNKLKHISSVVLLIFFGVSILQGLSPLTMQYMNTHHGGEVMICSMDGDCNSSCSLDKTKACSCNHTATNDDSNNTKLCGCDHNGNEPVGTNAPFQIKAPLVSAFDGITFSPTSILLNVNQRHLFIFTDDIFHPPRLSA